MTISSDAEVTAMVEGGGQRARWPYMPAGAYATAPGPDHGVNQDAAALPTGVPSARARQMGWLFAVADGVGGAAAGSEASSTACGALFERFYDDGSPASTRERLEAAVAAADEAVREIRSAPMPEERDDLLAATSQPPPASTLVAAAILGDEAWVAHIGDSRALLIRDGAAELITHDHTLVAGLVARGAISESEGEAHPQRHVLSRALGGDAAPDVVRLALRAGDRLVLVTDGVSKSVDASAISVAVTGRSTRRGARALVHAALSAATTDDATALVIDPNGGWPDAHTWAEPLVRSPMRAAMTLVTVVALAAALVTAMYWIERAVSWRAPQAGDGAAAHGRAPAAAQAMGAV